MSAIINEQGVPNKDEIATVGKDITFVPFLNTLRPQDDTLLSRGGSVSYKIYDEIERDLHAYGSLQKRKLAVIGRPWQVDPASDDARDIEAADMVREQLSNIGVPAENDPGEQVVVASNFDLVCYNLLDAILKGFSVGEIMWDVDPKRRQLVIREIRPRDQRRFNFDTDYKLRLKTWGKLFPGEDVPARKFIVHTFGSKNGSPFGLGLGTRLFWPVLFKKKDITFWLTFLDKFGSPTAVGKYPNGTGKPDQDKLLSALESIAQDTGVIVPEGMIIELLEAKRSGTVTYEHFCRYMDEEIDYAVLGEKGGKGSGGAQAAAAEERQDVRLELVQADADLLSATLNATLSPWLTAYNCPGARPPKIWRQVKKPEDQTALSTRDKNLFDMGFRRTLSAVQEAYGGEWVDIRPAGKVQSDKPSKPADFSEADLSYPDQDALDAAIADLPAEQQQAAMEKALSPVVKFIQKGGNAEEAMARIADVFPEMDTAFLEDMLSRAIFVAEIWGRISAQAEV